jgi:ceramide glucosyltransferase
MASALLNTIPGGLAVLSFVLTLWQWWVARRFPLHSRLVAKEKDATDAPDGTRDTQHAIRDTEHTSASSPAVTLLKPLKGCDDTTADCLRSWFAQDYAGLTQILFGVASAEDPVCALVRDLIAEFPKRDAQLKICGPLRGANLKVSKLIELERLAQHDLLVISDADVRVPPDFLSNLLPPLTQAPIEVQGSKFKVQSSRGHASTAPQHATLNRPYGLVNPFYRLANPSTLAMEWEAIAINADFWSQVLQSRSIKPLDFALGAVMATRRELLQEIGGFEALADCLADDYQLGNRLARRGHSIALCPVVVECWSEPMGWKAVWKHQLRWARTIRVCQPLPYFFSVLSNATLWPLLWVAAHPPAPALFFILACLVTRLLTATHLQRLISRERPTQFATRDTQYAMRTAPLWLIPLKDLLQAALWLAAFLGNRIEWRGERMLLRRDGTLVKSR